MDEDLEQKIAELVASLSPESYERFGPALREMGLALAERRLAELERVREDFERALEGPAQAKEGLERADERTQKSVPASRGCPVERRAGPGSFGAPAFPLPCPAGEPVRGRR